VGGGHLRYPTIFQSGPPFWVFLLDKAKDETETGGGGSVVGSIPVSLVQTEVCHLAGE